MIDKTVRKNLLAIADAYGNVTGMSRSDIGRKFYGRGSFLKDLRAGKFSPSTSQVDKLVAKFLKEWPKERLADWPFLEALFMDRK